ncbi:MAG: sensor histidine kinase N-terminal domain-containing protein [Variovorax sp.]
MKLFQRSERSLFGEILDWMLTPLLLLVPVSIGVTWLVAQGIANRPFDRALEHKLRTLAMLVKSDQGRVEFRLPQPVDQILRADDIDQIYFQIRTAAGVLLAGDADLPTPSNPQSAATAATGQTQFGAASPDEGEGITDDYEVHLRDDQMHNAAVRVAYTWVQPRARIGIGASAAPVLVQVAETREKQSVLAAEIIKGVLLPQFAILPLAILLIWLALVRGIKPLSQLEQTIRERKPGDLSPLDDRSVPYEVAPLVSSVNQLLTKLKDSLATQKRFLADAAHQLKTPLAGLRMQADLAQREGASADDLKLSLQQIGRSSVRATHTVNQLLALARAEGGAAALVHGPCDLAQLTIEVVRDAVPRAIDKHIDLGYDGLEPGAPGVLLQGNATLLRELVQNLVDNAIAYTRSSPKHPGVITARVLADPFGHVALLQVEDSGPGIAAGDRDLVFEPFYRVLGNDVDGSGLGLPIVVEIARQHRASVSLEDAHPQRQLPGSRFTVRFETGSAGGM